MKNILIQNACACLALSSAHWKHWMPHCDVLSKLYLTGIYAGKYTVWKHWSCTGLRFASFPHQPCQCVSGDLRNLFASVTSDSILYGCQKTGLVIFCVYEYPHIFNHAELKYFITHSFKTFKSMYYTWKIICIFWVYWVFFPTIFILKKLGFLKNGLLYLTADEKKKCDAFYWITLELLVRKWGWKFSCGKEICKILKIFNLNYR